MPREYKPGFTTLIESETFAKGLDETVVRAISAKKREPVRRPLQAPLCDQYMNMKFRSYFVLG